MVGLAARLRLLLQVVNGCRLSFVSLISLRRRPTRVSSGVFSNSGKRHPSRCLGVQFPGAAKWRGKKCEGNS